VPSTIRGRRSSTKGGGRTIAKYVAPPAGQPVPGYEMYVRTRDLAATGTWDDFVARKAVICGDPDTVVEALASAQQTYGFADLLCWTRLERAGPPQGAALDGAHEHQGLPQPAPPGAAAAAGIGLSHEERRGRARVPDRGGAGAR
jgi:hypothetical protein